MDCRLVRRRRSAVSGVGRFASHHFAKFSLCPFRETFNGEPGFEAFVKSVAGKTIVYVLEHLNTFEEQSAFTTWALKFAVRQALYELRQQHGQVVSECPALPEIPREQYDQLGRDEFMQYVHRVFKEELTDNQRTAIRAMIMSRVPKEEVATSLGMERCDYFKMIHDARLRLKHRLEADGFFSGIAKKNK